METHDESERVRSTANESIDQTTKPRQEPPGRDPQGKNPTYIVALAVAAGIIITFCAIAIRILG